MALAALVLAVLTLGPGLDGLLCKDEGRIGAASAELPATQVSSVDGHSDPPDGGPGVCAHGHCHHAAPYVPASPAAAEDPLDLLGPAHALPRYRAPRPDPTFGLRRPPRA